MSSLHVKYRPLSFGQVVGQEKTIRSLDRVANANRAHTFLFTGPSGTGKTTLSRLLANKFAGDKATVANIEEIDAATHSGAEAIRAVVSRTIFRAIGASPVKAIIIDECHRLSATAWDALLKPLEEPPKHVYWMLCSTNPDKIPKTIKTRCLSYELKPVGEEDLLGLLCKVSDAEGLNTADDVLESIASESNGSPRQALVFLEACQFSENVSDALRTMRSAAQSKGIIDICRFLMEASRKRASWAHVSKLVKSLDAVEPESCRIVINNYLGAVLLNAKTNNEASLILGLLECFRTPYNPSEKLAPLLYSIGLALGLDRLDV